METFIATDVHSNLNPSSSAGQQHASSETNNNNANSNNNPSGGGSGSSNNNFGSNNNNTPSGNSNTPSNSNSNRSASNSNSNTRMGNSKILEGAFGGNNASSSSSNSNNGNYFLPVVQKDFLERFQWNHQIWFVFQVNEVPMPITSSKEVAHSQLLNRLIFLIRQQRLIFKWPSALLLLRCHDFIEVECY